MNSNKVDSDHHLWSSLRVQRPAEKKKGLWPNELSNTSSSRWRSGVGWDDGSLLLRCPSWMNRTSYERSQGTRAFKMDRNEEKPRDQLIWFVCHVLFAQLAMEKRVLCDRWCMRRKWICCEDCESLKAHSWPGLESQPIPKHALLWPLKWWNRLV